MSWVLLTNDDGVDSPALVPFARALARNHEVRVVVPDGERSWSGKAITRFEPIRTEEVDRDGVTMVTHTGTPADGVQLGVHALFATPPSLVVSGINLGFNHGAGYVWSSGTVGAAVEGWVSGIPAIALSTGAMVDWEGWRQAARSPGSRRAWDQLASLCATLVDDLADGPVAELADIVSVNVPWDADPGTRRRVTRVARTGYDRLFGGVGDGIYVHDFGGGITDRGAVAGNDVDAAHDGVISITPLRMPAAAELPDEVVAGIERPGR
jgi:5'-nucleotidase